MPRIVTVESEEQLKQAAALFKEYGAIPGIEVCLKTFDGEVAALPGIYAPPAGRLLLAMDGDRAVGCVGISRLDDEACEMRRLYVRPEDRGIRAGLLLAQEALKEAARMGYKKINLETLPEIMNAAVSLYRSLGFKEADPYGEPKEGALIMSRDLD